MSALKKEKAMTTDYSTAIAACNQCALACEQCWTACLQEDDTDMLTDCIRTDIDCAGICRFTAALLARRSEFIEQVCQLCVEVCAKCATICEQHNHDHCQECAAACRACASACRALIN